MTFTARVLGCPDVPYLVASRSRRVLVSTDLGLPVASPIRTSSTTHRSVHGLTYELGWQHVRPSQGSTRAHGPSRSLVFQSPGNPSRFQEAQPQEDRFTGATGYRGGSKKSKGYTNAHWHDKYTNSAYRKAEFVQHRQREHCCSHNASRSLETSHPQARKRCRVHQTIYLCRCQSQINLSPMTTHSLLPGCKVTIFNTIAYAQVHGNPYRE